MSSVHAISSSLGKMSVAENQVDSTKNCTPVALNIDANLDSCSPIEAVVLCRTEPGNVPPVAQNIERHPSNSRDINITPSSRLHNRSDTIDDDLLHDPFMSTPNRKRVLGCSLRSRSRPCISNTETLPISPIARPHSTPSSEQFTPSPLSSPSCSPIHNRPIARARRVILSRDSTPIPTSPLTSSPIPVNKRLQSLVRDSHTSVSTPLAYLESIPSSSLPSPLSSPVTHRISPSSNLHNRAFREFTPSDFEDEKEIASKKRRF